MDRIKITAKTNEKIKQAVKLCRDSAERKKQGCFFLEGLRLCRDAAETGVFIETMFVTQDALRKYGGELSVLMDAAASVFEVTGEIADKLSDTKNPQGIFCVCKILDKSYNIDKIRYNGKYIAVENVQTPGNLGAAARTAEALGLDGMIVSGGCDRYNPKALRAAMGALMRLNVLEVPDLPLFLKQCREKGMKTYAAVPDRNALAVTEMEKTGGLVCVVGNEGSGLSDAVIASCCECITIPMKGRAESLNAAAAASVVMWEMVR